MTLDLARQDPPATAVRVCALDEIPIGLGRAFDVAGNRIALFRTRRGKSSPSTTVAPTKTGPSPTACSLAIPSSAPSTPSASNSPPANATNPTPAPSKPARSNSAATRSISSRNPQRETPLPGVIPGAMLLAAASSMPHVHEFPIATLRPE